MNWHVRLQQKMKEAGLTPRELAEKSGVHIKTVRAYLQGRVSNPRGSVPARLADAVGTTEIYLRYGDVPENIAGMRKIPLQSLSKIATLPSGKSPLATWDGVSVVSVPSELSEAAIAIRIDDESGAPEYNVGDLLVADVTEEAKPGELVVANFPKLGKSVFGEYRPKSIEQLNRFDIIPLNNAYPIAHATPEQPGEIKAVAIWHIRKIRR